MEGKIMEGQACTSLQMLPSVGVTDIEKRPHGN